MEQVYSETSNLVPTGTIIMYASNVAPFGYLICDGREVSRASYRILFNVIKTKFGDGNGSTTFNLPDFRNRFPMGAGDDFSMADTGGEHTHVINSNELPDHKHSGTTNSGGYGNSTGGPAVIDSIGVTSYAKDSGSHTHGFISDASGTLNLNNTRVQNNAMSILNKYLAIYYAIKY